MFLDRLDRIGGLRPGGGWADALGDRVERIPPQPQREDRGALGIVHLPRDPDVLCAVVERLRGAAEAADPVLQGDRAVVGALDRVEEVLAALFGLLHDRSDVLGVVAEPAIGARLEAAAKPDHQQNQEADADPDRDQPSEQVLLAAPLRSGELPPGTFGSLRRGNSLLFLVEECHKGGSLGCAAYALPCGRDARALRRRKAWSDPFDQGWGGLAKERHPSRGTRTSDGGRAHPG